MKIPQTPFSFKLPALLVLLWLAMMPAAAWAALNGYMSAEGETQGNIIGSVDIPPNEGKMEVWEFAHSVINPTDSASGLPSGKTQHRPIRISKPVDKASPILMNVLTNNENLISVRIDFWRPSTSGKEFQYFTVELVNASITGITQSHRSKDTDDGLDSIVKIEFFETITFTYQKIIWTWQDGGITAEDDWATPTP